MRDFLWEYTHIDIICKIDDPVIKEGDLRCIFMYRYQ